MPHEQRRSQGPDVSFLFENETLSGDDIAQFTPFGSKQSLDVSQRDADELESNDLLEHGDVIGSVNAISGGPAPGLEQPEPVIVMERPNAPRSGLRIP